MIKTFKYTTDLKEAYGVSQLGLGKGDTFKLINTKLSSIDQTSGTSSVYEYEYTIWVPKEGCYILDEEEWRYLILYSEFVDSEHCLFCAWKCWHSTCISYKPTNSRYKIKGSLKK